MKLQQALNHEGRQGEAQKSRSRLAPKQEVISSELVSSPISVISEEEFDHLDFATEFVGALIQPQVNWDVGFLFTMLLYRFHELAEWPISVVTTRIPENTIKLNRV